MAVRSKVAAALAWLPSLAVGQQDEVVPAPIDPFVQTHCIDCHGGDTVKGKFDLTAPPADAVDGLWRWSRMRERVLAGEMPPPDGDAAAEQDGPSVTERGQFAARVEQLLAMEVPRLPADPGRVTVRRLSRTHWRNAVHDLLGVQVTTAGFPADDLGYGFDSIGDALSFSTLHLEKYLAASREVAASVFHGEDPENPERRHFEAEAMHLVDDRGASMDRDLVNLFTNATLEQTVQLPRDGVYRLRIEACATQAGDEPAKMSLQLDGRELDVFEVANVEPQSFELTAQLTAGAHRLGLSFVNDYYDPKNPDPKQRDRNLLIDAFAVTGPTDVQVVPEQQRWLHEAAKGSNEIACLRGQIRAMLSRLWRRPVAPDELQRLQRVGSDRLRAGESLVSVQRLVLTAALTSPHFLFRIEHPAGVPDAQPISDFELASRLAFFLWASTPDAELLRLARQQRLAKEDVLIEQVGRMLAHERADSLATDFAAQWLELRLLAERTPDPERFPGFDDSLRRSMRRETELLFRAVLRDRRDVRELLDCDFTHVDRTMAQFYGLPHEGPPDAFVRVALVDASRLRAGLLGHASMHTVTSNPTRTSPVKRGKWMLENLLGQAPPPPPPGSDSFPDEAGIDSTAGLRVQMAQHREPSKCAVCHLRMDALGLALERFDAIGRFREQDAGGTIDASGVLPDGRRLDGLADLKRVLAADPAFVHTLAHKLFVYAIGRDLRPIDRLRVDLAVREVLARGAVTLPDLVRLVVRDIAFRQRRQPG